MQGKCKQIGRLENPCSARKKKEVHQIENMLLRLFFHEKNGHADSKCALVTQTMSVKMQESASKLCGSSVPCDFSICLREDQWKSVVQRGAGPNRCPRGVRRANLAASSPPFGGGEAGGFGPHRVIPGVSPEDRGGCKATCCVGFGCSPRHRERSGGHAKEEAVLGRRLLHKLRGVVEDNATETGDERVLGEDRADSLC